MITHFRKPRLINTALHEFFVNCNPPKSTAQAQHKIMKTKDGRQFVGTQNSKTKDTMIELLSPHAPDERIEGVLTLEIFYVWPWRSSTPKYQKAMGFWPSDKRPDVDNLAKNVKDTMTLTGYWYDDGQVAWMNFVKGWGDQPGIWGKISKLEVAQWEDMF